MEKETAHALTAFTERYCNAWHEQRGSWPQSEELYGIPSPCIITSSDNYVIWQPQPFLPPRNVNPIEQAMEIVIQTPIQAYYTTQFAGDMTARFGDLTLTLLQSWSEDDFVRMQENLIGHLVTQKRLKLTPTLFIATLESELEVISFCNLRGEVIQETLGTRQRTVLSPNLVAFLDQLEPVV